MALFQAFHEPRQIDPNSGILTVADDQLIQVVVGTVTFDYHGAGFAYDFNGALIGGMFTGFEMYDSANGGLQVSISGLAIPAVTFFEAAFSGDPDALDRLWFAGDDTLIGAAGDDDLSGYAGIDSLVGGEGSDHLEGGDDTLADTLVGGPGDDVYVVGGSAGVANDVVVEVAGGGMDTVVTFGSYTLAANVENLVVAANAIGGYGGGNALDNSLLGNADANLLEGFDGNDTLDGGVLGADTLRGGAGNDSYIVDHWGVVVDESTGSGNDTVTSSVSFNLGAGVENLVLTGSERIGGRGNELANVITGNDAGDQLDGGAGNDTLNGGFGNDIFYVDSVGDVIHDSGGDDTVRATAQGYVLAAGIENLELDGYGSVVAYGNDGANNIVGSGAENILYGMGGDDTLNGGTGSEVDTLVGGDGNDVYWLDVEDDTIVEDANGGDDVVYAFVSHTLEANVENLVLYGYEGAMGVGNALDNRITGTAWTDTLDGAAGADTMAGLEGVDTYYVDDVGDVIVEAGDDEDTVIASIDYVLPGDVEDLELAGSAVNGTGNAQQNRIAGNAGANVIDGKAGADTMIGGQGDDQYVVDDAGDVVVEQAGEGNDTIVTLGISVVAADNVERVDGSVAGTANFDITGNALANFLRGSDGANVIDGSAGADTMVGLGGDDIYVVDDSGDVVTEASGQGTDTVLSKLAAYTLAGNVENLRLLAGAGNGTGNALGNSIVGNAADNVLTGGAGDDTLDGDAGYDTAVFSGKQSTYTIARGQGSVTVTGADGTDLLTGVDALVFSDQTVVLDPHQAAGSVQIEGTAKADRVLTATATGVADADGVGALAYQWFHGGVAIAGATSATYEAASTDVGMRLSVRLRFIDGLGNTETLWSDSTDLVVSTEHVPPTIIDFLPEDGATGVQRDANLLVRFSEWVQRGTGTIVLAKSDGAVVESFDAATSNSISISGNTVIVDPTVLLDFGTTYTLKFAAGSIVDFDGNPYDGSRDYAFTSWALPHIVDVVPTAGMTTSPSYSASFAVYFAADVQRGPGAIDLETSDGTKVGASVSVSGSTVYVTPAHDLIPGMTYHLELAADALRDLAGNGMLAATTKSLTVEAVTTTGTAGNDHVMAFASSFVAGTGAGNDTIECSYGHEVLDGGTGLDTVVIGRSLADSTLLVYSGGLTVLSKLNDYDIETVVNVERLKFTDFGMAFDIDGNAGKAYRLYQAAFNRKPDIGGLGYQMHDLDIGVSLEQVASNFIASPEFQATYGSVDDTQFLTLLYANVLHRAPDDGGLQFHLGEFARGESRAEMLIHFSESPENQANVIGDIQHGMVYLW